MSKIIKIGGRDIDISEATPFSSIVPPHEQPLEGKKIYIRNILDKEIIITNFRVSKSKKNDGQCLCIQLVLGDEICVIFTGSSVLISQLERVKDKLPIRTSIKKIDKFFTLT
jgi:hypothetical protein